MRCSFVNGSSSLVAIVDVYGRWFRNVGLAYEREFAVSDLVV